MKFLLLARRLGNLHTAPNPTAPHSNPASLQSSAQPSESLANERRFSVSPLLQRLQRLQQLLPPPRRKASLTRPRPDPQQRSCQSSAARCCGKNPCSDPDRDREKRVPTPRLAANREACLTVLWGIFGSDRELGSLCTRRDMHGAARSTYLRSRYILQYGRWVYTPWVVQKRRRSFGEGKAAGGIGN